MTLRFELRLSRGTIAVSGIAGLVVMLGILSLPSFFAASLDAMRAEHEIRFYLKRQLSSQLMADMQAAGVSAPDAATAARWQAGYERIDRLEFASLKVRRFIFVPPFTSHRLFVVRAVIREGKQGDRARYFSFSARNKFFDVFWVAEQSKLMWLLSF